MRRKKGSRSRLCADVSRGIRDESRAESDEQMRVAGAARQNDQGVGKHREKAHNLLARSLPKRETANTHAVLALYFHWGGAHRRLGLRCTISDRRGVAIVDIIPIAS